MFFIKLMLLCSIINSAFSVESYIKCKTSLSDTKDGALVNIEKDCQTKPCVTKCCEVDEIIQTEKHKYKCVKIKDLESKLKSNNITYDFTNMNIYYKPQSKDKPVISKSVWNDFRVLRNGVPFSNSSLDCYNSPRYEKSKSTPFYLLENGHIAGMSDNNWFSVLPGQFCSDLTVGQNSKNPSVWMAIYMHYQMKTEKSKAPIVFNSAAMCISCMFITLVLLVYCILPKLRNLAGMMLMAYLTSQLVAYLVKCAINLYVNRMSSRMCLYFVGPMMYFSVVSSMLWLNVMSYDMWWTFRGVLLKRAINRQGELMKFMWYSVYAYGVTALLMFTAILIDNSSSANIIKPGFQICLQDTDPNKVYFFGPMAVITAFNILLFVLTIYNICLIKKQLNDVKNVSFNQKNKMFHMFIKMSLLTGISWALEVIQAYVDNIPDWLIIILSFYNAFIGVAFFFLFIVFNQTTLIMLCKKFNIKWNFNKENMNLSTRTTESRPSTNKGSYTKTKTTDDDLELSEIEITSQSKI